MSYSKAATKDAASPARIEVSGSLLREFLNRGISAFAVKVISVGAAFGANVIAARAMALQDAGIFFLLLGFIPAASAFCRLGLDKVCVREVAKAHSGGDPHGADRAKESALWASTFAALAFALAVALLAKYVAAALWQREEMAAAIIMAALSLPAYGAVVTNAMFFQGAFRPNLSIFFQGGAVPLFLAGALLPFSNLSAYEGSVLLFGAVSVAFTTSVLVQGSRFSSSRADPRLARSMVTDGLHLLVIQAAVLLSAWLAQLMVSAFRSPAEAALFYAAERTSLLVAFVLYAVNAIASPHFAALHRGADAAGLEAAGRATQKLAIAMGLPIFLVVMLFAEELLALFGQKYRQAAGALRILAIGQLVNAASGPVANLLIMAGRERIVRRNVTMAVGLTAALCVMLIPSFGLLGGAIATAAGVASSNALCWYYVRRELGIRLL